MLEARAGSQTMSVSLKLTYDATVDVAYLTLRPTGPADVLGPTLLLENDRAFPGAVAMDFGLLDGRAVGFEFQMASACLPAELLVQAECSDGRSLSDRFEARILRGVPQRHRSGGLGPMPFEDSAWEEPSDATSCPDIPLGSLNCRVGCQGGGRFPAGPRFCRGALPICRPPLMAPASDRR